MRLCVFSDRFLVACVFRHGCMLLCFRWAGRVSASRCGGRETRKVLTVRWIKGSIAAAIGMSRHRQRLFLHEALLGDDYTLTCVYGPLVVQLVILPFVTHDPVVVSDLNLAAAANNEMTVEEMLQLPLDPNQDDFDGVTPLCVAAEAGAATTVCLLVEVMADTERVGQRQQTPLHLAAQGGRHVVVKLLLEASASTNHRDVNGKTALHVAVCNNFSRQVALLLQHRAAVSPSDRWRQTPLFLAAEENDVIICRLLLDARADMRAKDCYGDTPLHAAVRGCCYEAAELLIEYRASPAIANNAGHNALQIARASDDDAMHQLFFFWLHWFLLTGGRHPVRACFFWPHVLDHTVPRSLRVCLFWPHEGQTRFHLRVCFFWQHGDAAVILGSVLYLQDVKDQKGFHAICFPTIDTVTVYEIIWEMHDLGEQGRAKCHGMY